MSCKKLNKAVTVFVFLAVFLVWGSVCMNIALAGTDPVRNAFIPIDEAHFPDPAFRSYVRAKCDADHDGTLSDPEIQAVTSIFCPDYSIASLAGIEYFSALDSLECFANNLSRLDVSNNKNLRFLECSDNQLTSIKLCADGALNHLSCAGNKLKTLKLNRGMEYLDCSGNRISMLDVTGCPKLREAVRKERRGNGDDFDTFGVHIDVDGEYAYYNLVFDTKVTVKAGPIVSRHNYTDYTLRNVIYRVKKGKVTAIGTDKKEIKALTISDGFRLQGRQYKVTAIAEGAFRNLSKLAEVTIGKNIREIGGKAFYFCKKLMKITINTLSLKKIAGYAFKGIHGKAVFYCPEKTFSRYKSLIKKSGVPSTVKYKKR